MIAEFEILKARILIVDDQEANVQLLEQLLADTGYSQVTSTRQPTDVLELHRKNQYDLILLDLQMPVLDGFQVIARLKADQPDDYPPILAITAQPGHKLRALQAGAKDFISKPFDLTEVRTRIHNLLEMRLRHVKLMRDNQELVRQVEERTAELRNVESRFRNLTEHLG